MGVDPRSADTVGAIERLQGQHGMVCRDAADVRVGGEAVLCR